MARPRLHRDAPGVPARRAALRLLDAVLRRGLALEAALDTAARGLDKREDRALAHAIAAETLRHLHDCDALIDSATARPLPDDAKARFALRIALTQALAMGVAHHAAIATVLPLVDGGPRKLVHGVFGTLIRKGVTFPNPPALPPAVAQRWQTSWGEDIVRAAGAAIAAPPPIDVTLKPDADPTALEGESLLPGHVRLSGDTSVPARAGFAEGQWWVQDIAASLPARLAGRGAGTALDLCAAPGGKTMQLAAAGWQVTALDRSENRLARLHANLERTGLTATVIAADALEWTPEQPVDLILLDAPCSATGIFRRHPDVLHRVRPAIIAEMAELQARLLARAADWVRPGGQLVYATCSLEPEEGERQIEAFLKTRSDYRVEPETAVPLPDGVMPFSQGWIRTLPGTLADKGGMDGFFICRMIRKG
ncbi:RsmB/NOP family class I SAM-dependent RNA methyltransferase [Stakelama sediminis]|uniref:16S rRNA (Cytosine967-C5)-methyltransferase n=1 Tax=Stakelama sediminis TaxID=463200 RepID=A0A840YZ98_9SPHN|nr:RsmB/NOP family class I SAM-dependent RNA methyltransferase [Stakelama sediminis]MBB5719131.1 16S rRNA (cytosine967-C5)-methyltransferase [Stakelama sediminis]